MAGGPAFGAGMHMTMRTGRWEFVLTPMDVGCRVAITEFGEVANPYFRVMAKMFMKPEAHMELYLAALATKFGEPVAFI